MGLIDLQSFKHLIHTHPPPANFIFTYYSRVPVWLTWLPSVRELYLEANMVRGSNKRIFPPSQGQLGPKGPLRRNCRVSNLFSCSGRLWRSHPVSPNCGQSTERHVSRGKFPPCFHRWSHGQARVPSSRRWNNCKTKARGARGSSQAPVAPEEQTSSGLHS